MTDDTRGGTRDKAVSKPTPGKQPVIDLFPVQHDRRMLPMTAMRPQPSKGEKMGTRISVFSPVSFEEAIDIVECLQCRGATTISLENMKKVDAGRLVDFVAGASAALDGDFHKLNDQVYLFCPSNIKITASDLKSNGKKSDAPDDLNTLDFLSGFEPRTPTSVWTQGQSRH